MRKVLKGKGVSNGIGFGKVVLLKPEDLKVEKSKIDNVEEETEKFNEALNSVIKDTEEIITKIFRNRKRHNASIFNDFKR